MISNSLSSTSFSHSFVSSNLLFISFGVFFISFIAFSSSNWVFLIFSVSHSSHWVSQFFSHVGWAFIWPFFWTLFCESLTYISLGLFFWDFILFFCLENIFLSAHFFVCFCLFCLFVCFYELGEIATSPGLKRVPLWETVPCVDCLHMAALVARTGVGTSQRQCRKYWTEAPWGAPGAGVGLATSIVFDLFLSPQFSIFWNCI